MRAEVDASVRQCWPATESLMGRIMAADAVTYLPDDVLTKVDRATMAVGLEARVPLLAPEMVRLAARLPDSMRVRGGDGKWALRQLLLRRHPASLVQRPKSGFGVPIASWLRGPLRPWAEDLLSPTSLDATDMFRDTPVRTAWDDHVSRSARRFLRAVGRADGAELAAFAAQVRIGGRPTRSSRDVRSEVP